MNTNQTNTPSVELLKTLLIEANEVVKTLDAEIEANNALPKGKRGKKSASIALEAKRDTAEGTAFSIASKLREELRSEAFAIAIAKFKESVKDLPTMSKMFDARSKRAIITDDARGNKVLVFFDFWLESIEVRSKSSNDEVIAHVATATLKENKSLKSLETWLADLTAKNDDPEQIKTVQRDIDRVKSRLVMLAEWGEDPENATHGRWGFSVDVRGSNLNASTFDGNIDDANVAVGVIEVAMKIATEAKFIDHKRHRVDAELDQLMENIAPNA
jgi:hypothetical protein